MTTSRRLSPGSLVVLVVMAILYPVVLRLAVQLADYSTALLDANLEALAVLGSAIANPQQPFSFERAMAILEERRGVHFDPVLLDLFRRPEVTMDAVGTVPERLRVGWASTRRVGHRGPATRPASATSGNRELSQARSTRASAASW